MFKGRHFDPWLRRLKRPNDNVTGILANSANIQRTLRGDIAPSLGVFDTNRLIVERWTRNNRARSAAGRPAANMSIISRCCIGESLAERPPPLPRARAAFWPSPVRSFNWSRSNFASTLMICADGPYISTGSDIARILTSRLSIFSLMGIRSTRELAR